MPYCVMAGDQEVKQFSGLTAKADAIVFAQIYTRDLAERLNVDSSSCMGGDAIYCRELGSVQVRVIVK